MKRNYLLVISIIFFTNIIAQQNILIPAKYNNTWGATDINHNEVIPFSYSKVSFYSFGYYLVENNGKKGLYNSEGKQILSTIYDAIKPLNEYRFQVYKNRKTGIVTTYDKEIIPIRFSTIVSYKLRNAYIVSYLGNYALYNTEGEKIIPFGYDNISFYEDDYYLLRKGKKFAVTTNINNIKNVKFYDDIVKSNDFFIVRNEDKYGALDKNCNEVIEVEFENIEVIGEKFLAIKKREQSAFFDIEGNRISRYKFEEPFYLFGNDICWTLKDENWYRYNLKEEEGEVLDSMKILSFDKGYYRILKNNFVEIVDKKENTHFSGKYHDIIPLSDTLFKVQLNRKWGVINQFDEVVLPILYDNVIFNKPQENSPIRDSRIDEVAKKISKDYSSLFVIHNNEKYGVSNLKGEEIVPLMYDEVGVSTKDMMIWTKLNGLYGVYNRRGDVIFHNEYNAIAWSENQKLFTLNKANYNMVISDTIGNITYSDSIEKIKWSSKKSMFFSEKNGKNGLMNIYMENIIPFRYKKLYDLGENYFVGVLDSGVIVYDSEAEKLSNYLFTSLELINFNENEFIIVKKGEKFGVIKQDGNVLIPYEYDNILFDKKHGLFSVKVNSVFLGYFNTKGERYF